MRFGDQLCHVFHALLTSYQLHIPFLYTPLSKECNVLFSEHPFFKMTEPPSHKVYHVKRGQPFQNPMSVNRYINKVHSPAIYMIHGLGSQILTLANKSQFSMWLRQIITQPKHLNLALPPKDGSISVAVHLRKGSGPCKLDQKALAGLTSWKMPNNTFGLASEKFLPEAYYIAQIRYLANKFHNKQLYVFLFTDSPLPELLCKEFSQKINKENVALHSRQNNPDQHETGVLDDFFSILHYDVLVRSYSHFALAAEILGDHQLILSPDIQKKGRMRLLTGARLKLRGATKTVALSRGF